MKMFRFIPVIAIIFSLSMVAYGQEQKDPLQRANEAFKRSEYASAAQLFEAVLANRKKANPEILSKLALCYQSLNKFQQASNTYALLASVDSVSFTKKPLLWFNYANMLLAIGNYAEAKEAYKKYAAISGESAALKTASCDSAMAWVQMATKIQVENIKSINTGGADWGASWYPKDQIVFVSDSMRTTKMLYRGSKVNEIYDEATGKNFEKIYVVDTAVTSGIDRDYVHDFSPVMNDFRYHSGPVSFSKNYDSAFFTVTYVGEPNNADKVIDHKSRSVISYGVRRMELYLSIKNKSNEWGTPTKFPYCKPDSYSVGQAALSKDGSVLYFVSDMSGGFGKSDIWFCIKTSNNTWSEPQNCGAAINTDEAEVFPTIGYDNTFYFSTKGRVGMGGLDIFKAVGQRNVWQAVSNLKSPINSGYDDFFYTPKDEYSGFFSSNRAGGKGGDDIYQYLIVPEYVYLNAAVLDSVNSLRVSDAKVHIQAGNVKSDTITTLTGKVKGKFRMPVALKISIDKEGYYPFNKVITDTSLLNSYEQFFELLPIPVVKDTIAIADSLAALKVQKEQVTLTYTDKKLLDEIVESVKENAAARIVLLPNENSNLILDNANAGKQVYQLVESYLTESGVSNNIVSSEQQVAKGYSLQSSNPILGNLSAPNASGLLHVLVYTKKLSKKTKKHKHK